MGSRLRNRKKKTSIGDTISDSGGKFWLWAFSLVGALIVIPIFWLIALRLLSGPFVLTGDASGLLATIGGVMGAIFTVGGLVIALVSVLTQLTLQERVRRVTQKARQEVLELSSSIEAQVNQQVRGHLLRNDAEAALKDQAWEKAEGLIREALRVYPQVQRARSLLGMWLSEPLIVDFLRRHGIHDYDSYLNKPTGLFTLKPKLIPPPVSTAIDWLEDAVKHSDNPEGQAWIILALLYGIRMDFKKMIDAIQAAKDANIEGFAHFMQPDYLMMLLYGCKGAYDQQSATTQLFALLNFSPPTPEQILERLQAIPDNINWLALGNVEYWANQPGGGRSPDFPALVQISKSGEVKEGVDLWRFHYSNAGTSPLLPEQLINEITKRVILLCPVLRRRILSLKDAE